MLREAPIPKMRVEEKLMIRDFPRKGRIGMIMAKRKLRKAQRGIGMGCQWASADPEVGGEKW